MEQEIFDEVEHWLEFIKHWEKENDDKVPDEVLRAIELALDKAVCLYKEQASDAFDYFH